MSNAIICDKCGRIMPTTAKIWAIWTRNPFLSEHLGVEPDLHLCASCFDEFEDVYTANFKEQWEEGDRIE